MTTTPDVPKEKLDRRVAKRWTPTIASAGWTPVSDFFLLNYHCLKPEMTSAEAMFVIQLMHHKRDENPPYPGFKSLATRMGVGVGTARGYARELERKGYLRREKRIEKTNKFHLEPLFDAIEKAMSKSQPKPKRSAKAARADHAAEAASAS